MYANRRWIITLRPYSQVFAGPLALRFKMLIGHFPTVHSTLSPARETLVQLLLEAHAEILDFEQENTHRAGGAASRLMSTFVPL